jgi:hypothetical protein
MPSLSSRKAGVKISKGTEEKIFPNIKEFPFLYQNDVPIL